MNLLIGGSPKSLARQVGVEMYAANLGALLGPRNWGNYALDAVSYGAMWAADNDAFNGFDRDRFIAMLRRIQGVPNCLFVAIPDVVADASATMLRFRLWQPAVRYLGFPVAFVAQDGQEALETPWEAFDCLFIGGSTGWKLSIHAARLVQEAKTRGKWVHMGRVNSNRRIHYAKAIGCDSCDGTGYTRFSKQRLPLALPALRHHTIAMEGFLC